MNNIYNLAHQLANALKNSDEYKNYVEKRNDVYSNAKNKEMVENFKEQAINFQMQQMSGEEVNQEELEKIQKLEEVLKINPTINEFFSAEIRFSQVIQDINNILSEAIDINDK